MVVTVSRTPHIGVGGVILNGGLGWMSTEYGCICDPVNFVDAEVVNYDGTIVKASDEKELLWALRGSGGGFGSKNWTTNHDSSQSRLVANLLAS